MGSSGLNVGLGLVMQTFHEREWDPRFTHDLAHFHPSNGGWRQNGKRLSDARRKDGGDVWRSWRRTTLAGLRRGLQGAAILRQGGMLGAGPGAAAAVAGTGQHPASCIVWIPFVVADALMPTTCSSTLRTNSGPDARIANGRPVRKATQDLQRGGHRCAALRAVAAQPAGPAARSSGFSGDGGGSCRPGWRSRPAAAPRCPARAPRPRC